MSRSCVAAWTPSSLPGGGHADVGDDDVRGIGGDRGEERREVLDQRDDLDVGLGAQELRDPFAHEERVLGHHHPNRHVRRLRRWPRLA